MTSLIKRYPNRRLYDTGESRYITIDELGQYIVAGKQVKIVDSKSQADLTRRVLVQVLLTEGHVEKLDCLPVDFLRTLIRLRDRSLMNLFEHYVSLTLGSFSVAQQAMDKNLELMRNMAPNPRDLLGILNPFGRGRGGGSGDGDGKT